MRRALVIGIDDYPTKPLHGCVNDATTFATLLESHEDGSPNFEVKLITSNETEVSNDLLYSSIHGLFDGDAETVLLFFAGHGYIDSFTNLGFIIAQNGQRGSWGFALYEILELANKAYPKIKSSVIILDCCNSGALGELPGGPANISVVGNGVTILTACHRDGGATEIGGNGLFTSILKDGLEGAASDICGRITPASLYSHVDQVLGPWDQRPLYKANVQSFITVRKVLPRIPLEILRELPSYFPEVTSIFELDPSFESDRENIPEKFRALPINPENIRLFKNLQLLNRHGLVVPVDAEHMYYAAINSTGCRLTATGVHYRKLAEWKRV